MRTLTCVDYRGVNKLTIPDKYLMPRIAELIDRDGECKGRYFTCWNKVSFELQKEVKEITTDGSVQHKLLPAEAVIQERERRTHGDSLRSNPVAKKPASSQFGKGQS